MESEQCPMVQYPHRTIPAAHYYCASCDSEWAWTKGVRKLWQIDGRDYLGGFRDA